MILEFHKLECNDASLDLFFHNKVVLFNTKTRQYYYCLEDTNSPVYAEDEVEMRKNNSVSSVLSLDAYAFEQEMENVLKVVNEYNYCYEKLEYNYFSESHNSCNISIQNEIWF